MITLIGQIVDAIGQSACESFYETPRGLVRRRYDSWRTDVDTLRRVQAPKIPLTADHQLEVGEVLSLTRAGNGGVYAVGVADADALLDVDEPIYFSPTIDARARDGGDGIFLEVAVTFATARIAPEPVMARLRGDVRKPVDRASWVPPRGYAKALIDQTVNELRHRPAGAAIELRDFRPSQRSQPVPSHEINWDRLGIGRHPLGRRGAIEHSAWAGRILSVR